MRLINLKFIVHLVFAALLFSFPNFGLSVPTTYVSAEDEDITLRSIVVSQGKDNVQGIYVKPLAGHLVGLLTNEHFLDLNPYTSPDTLDINELKSNSKLTSEIINKNKSDGLLHLQITKGQMGLLLELGLFTKKSGLLWAYTENLEKEKLDIESLKKNIDTMYGQIMNQIPYQGIILSRSSNRITVNRGSLSNMRVDQDIDVIQIVGAKRHPQFQFITQIQKEIIGKIRITKVDENLSFGYLLFEKEPQAVQAGLKILLKEPTYYPQLATSKNEAVVDHLLARKDGGVMLRGDSSEWRPLENPTFGRAYVLFGMGQFASSTNLSTDGGQQGSTILAFNAQADADIWMTRKWFLRVGLNQGSAQINNPLSGSSPSKINYSIQGLKTALGYDFEISPTIYGPRIQAMLGYSLFNANATESTPTSFTSTVYSGLGLGLSGYMPWNDENSKWGFGAELWYHLAPSVTESPVTSGTPEKIQIVELSGSAHYRWRPDISWISKLTFTSLSSSFSGTGTRAQAATSSDLSWIRVNGGMEYLF